MRQLMLLTLSGSDRPGIVEHVTRLLVSHDANVEGSRMARLGGEFAMLVLVSAPDTGIDRLKAAVEQLGDESFVVHTRLTDVRPSAAGSRRAMITVYGADHLGIVHAVARDLARRSVNVESLDTEVVAAPMSGQPLFRMRAAVTLPPGLLADELAETLEAVGDEMNVGISVEGVGE
jgi:glycine cleavage system transcriptional repressor